MAGYEDRLSSLKKQKGQLELAIENTYITATNDFSTLHSLQRKLADTIKEIRRIIEDGTENATS